MAALAAHDATGEIEELRTAIADADTKIVRYRATLDAGGDPALIGGWITEAMTIKKAPLRHGSASLRRHPEDDRRPIDAIADTFRYRSRPPRDVGRRGGRSQHRTVGFPGARPPEQK